MMKNIWQDLRFAVRLLAKNPGFTALVVLMLAIGIGINSTAFTFLDRLVLRSLPAKDPGQLVYIDSRKQGEFKGFSYPDYQDICRQSTSLSGVVAMRGNYSMVDRNGETEMISTETVSENFFSVLGIPLELGQPFVPQERWDPSEAPPVIISHSLWQRRFGADPEIIGKTMVLQKRNAVIRGVVSKSFVGLKSPLMTDLWVPYSAWTEQGGAGEREHRFTERLIGRLRPGTNIETARAELDTIAHRLGAAYPATNQGIIYTVSPVETEFVSALMYAGVVLCGPFLILIICCANVSSMMLARTEERRNEIAVRLALGSGRFLVLRQLMAESLLLAFMGTVLGLVFTLWLITLIPVLIPPLPMDIRLNIGLDIHVFLFAFAATIAAALISGLAPAFHALKGNLAPSLKTAASRGEARKFAVGLRSALVAGQVALSLVLLVSTGLFLKSLLFTEKINPGFDTRKKLLILNFIPFVKDSNQNFFLPVMEQIKSIPGVKRASYAFRMPMSGSGGGHNSEISIPGIDPPKGQKSFTIGCNSVGRDYFQTVGTRMLRGRPFDHSDELPGKKTVIINETMAKRIWHAADPIGARLVAKGKEYEIVGIAQDNVEDIHGFPGPYFYFHFAQVPMGESAILVETTGDPMAVVAPVKEKIRNIDKVGVMLRPGTLEDLMSLALIKDRMLFFGAGALGIIGVVLAAVGLYAVVSYLARCRTHEIGIRVALGAQHADISRLVIGRGFRVCLIGIGIGLIASYLAMKLLSQDIYGVAPTDAWTFLSCAVAVLAISVLASYIPARRAARIDPIAALRYE